jgi:alkylation response protein AidB-like acyl-CoA dehydrogenase
MIEPKTESAEQSEFRAECRAWLQDNLPPAPEFTLPQGPLAITNREQLDYLCAWQRRAYAAGWVGCDYPKAYGGGGRRNCQWIANQEMQAAGAPFLPNVVGLGMAAPTILHHGTEQQKRELLPPLLAGDEIWCQGFSEPNAGSDLANVQTFARREGERWIIEGHKVWTTLAHFAAWMILLCRTDKADKYGGLTYFVVPMNTEGVCVRPLVKMTGEAGFNEVLLDEVVIEDRHRLDEIGQGWKVAMTTLLHERGAGGLVTPVSGATVGVESAESLGAGGLIELAHRSYRGGDRGGQPAAEDPVIRDRIVRLLIRERAFEQSSRRAKVPALVDHPFRIPLQHKLILSELLQHAAALGCEIDGLASTLHHSAGGRWPLAHMNSYGFTIAAGSSEIQRNVLGERVLGLPKSK